MGIIFNCVRTALAAIAHLDQARKHRGGAQPLVGKVQWSLAWGLTWMVVVKFIAKCLLKVAFCFTFFSCDDYLQSCHVILLMNGEGSRGNVQEDIRSFKLFSNGSIAV